MSETELLAQILPQPGSVEARALDAAVECFGEKGFNKVTMADVASAAGMARSTLYRYFRERDDLIIGVVERESILMSLSIYQRIRRFSNIEDYVVEGVIAALDEMERNSILMRLFSDDSAALAGRILLSTNRVQEIGVKVLKYIVSPTELERGLRNDVDGKQIIDWILRVLVSIKMMPSEYTVSETACRKLLKDMLLPALVNRP
ncbi:MAG: TetR/AcrR family transcriptional regulator [Pseudomonadales bacterium]|nr:TetR/AcrR family transcriptional regulator [Pseudomonadales bacterium]